MLDLPKVLGCQLCYSLVPKKDLDTLVYDQAAKKAKAYLKNVGHSMALESQGTSAEIQKIILKETIERILQKPHLLWEEDGN